GDGTDLGGREAARVGAARREFLDRAADLHEVAGRRQRAAWHEHEDGVRRRRIAVAGRVLNVEAAAAFAARRGVHGGDDALRDHRRAGERRSVAAALYRIDRRDRHVIVDDGAGRAAGADRRRAARVLEVAEVDR